MPLLSINNHGEDRSLRAELKMVEAAYPRVYKYIQELEQNSAKFELPRFDDNDEIVKEED
jgi:hypothetical protein